jgi:DNA-binding NtrC family response regulator
MSTAKVLVVDDNSGVRVSLQQVLEHNDFEVVASSGVNDALQRISTERFDVLLSDLHMPGRGDGLTVVSAMRHANPEAVTLVFSGFPEMRAAAARNSFAG